MTAAGHTWRWALVLSFAPAVAWGQSADVLLNEGVRAYRDLQFAAATQLLHRALDAKTLTPAERVRGLMYLGASQVFQDNTSDATAALRELVLLDPRFRPDSLVFPPRVTQLFAGVVQTTKAVALIAPARARFRPGEGTLTILAYASSRHQIEADILAPNGSRVAALYNGSIVDSVMLSWDGRTAAGPAPPGRYELRVASHLATDEVLRSVSLPLELSLVEPDTLPWPTAPGRRRRGWKSRTLLVMTGIGAGLVVPAAVGIGDARSARIALGAVVTAIGVGLSRPAQLPPAAVADTAWQATLAGVQAENARRRARDEVVVRVGSPERTERTAR